MDVALVSCANLPEPDPDAVPLIQGLAAAGIEAEVVAWDDAGVDWSRAPLTILRSAWNYPLHHEAFLRWAEKTAGRSRLWNPLPVVRWNSHKGYLLELERQDVPIVPTVLVRAGSDRPLEVILAERGWAEVVIKPAVSSSSYRTMRFGPDAVDAGEAHVRALVADGDALVQEYLPSVEGHGERAVMCIDGKLTHAIRKSPRFHGDSETVTTTAVAVAPAEAALARRALGTVRSPLLYGRVDVAPGPDGDPVVMELELIEPSLYFTHEPQALARFVQATKRLLRRASGSGGDQ